MSLLDLFQKKALPQDDNDEKVIDLSDSTQYPASVLTDLNCGVRICFLLYDNP